MGITVREESGKVVILQTPSRFTVEIASDFKDMLNDFVRDEKYCFVIDLSLTEYMDSSGLGAVVSRIAATRANNGDIRLAAPTKFVEDLLELTQLKRILKIYEDVDTAIKSFN